jgi:hypothetical protein
MPNQVSTEAGDSLISLAQRHLGDFRRWRDVAAQNGINPLEGLATGLDLDIPTPDELLKVATPILSKVSAGVNAAQQVTEQIGQVLQSVGGYTPEAQKLLGEVNGVLGEVESTLGQVDQKVGELRDYASQGVRLIDWLLN